MITRAKKNGTISCLLNVLDRKIREPGNPSARDLFICWEKK
jgi:hypothetical protein